MALPTPNHKQPETPVECWPVHLGLGGRILKTSTICNAHGPWQKKFHLGMIPLALVAHWDRSLWWSLPFVHPKVMAPVITN
jgi:hypothetical protein